MDTLELIQKHTLHGRREFKLDAEEIHYVIHSPLRNDALSVALHVLDAQPVRTGSILAFVSQINREPLVELIVDKPDKNSFDSFIAALQQRISAEDFSRFHVSEQGVQVDLARLDEAVEMLQRYVDPTEINPLLSALSALQASPKDIACQQQVAAAFNELGFVQGQVLTYAPYLTHLLFGNDEQGSFLG